MQEELLFALPPLSDQDVVCDVCSGTGALASKILNAYPNISRYVCVENSQGCVAVASKRLAEYEKEGKVCFLTEPYTCEGGTLPTPADDNLKVAYTCIVASLALHVLVGHDVERAQAIKSYERFFSDLFASLAPGGHLIVGDHVGSLPLFDQLLLIQKAGFVDVDVAWRQRDFFVCGARKPKT
eukprot:comp21180_c0_seq1/m.28718 comp21180_c0_seq1/g.28718  ORF comp21180_c0_seq1/g.28718 comp21180_c0_seq1/m.28718 type:complete len:183 (-) comp21180_c0_seq1:366-914(-)